MQGHVYFLATADESEIKIGTTLDLVGGRRLRDLTSVNAKPLKLEVAIHGHYAVETFFKRHFGVHQAHGEWFTYDAEIKNFVLKARANPNIAFDMCRDAWNRDEARQAGKPLPPVAVDPPPAVSKDVREDRFARQPPAEPLGIPSPNPSPRRDGRFTRQPEIPKPESVTPAARPERVPLRKLVRD